MTHIKIKTIFKQLDTALELSKEVTDKVELPLIVITRLNNHIDKYNQFKKDYLNYGDQEVVEEIEEIFSQLEYDFTVLLPETTRYLEDSIPLIKNSFMDNFSNVLGIKMPITFKNVSCKKIKGVELLCQNKNIFNEIKKETFEIYEINIPIFSIYTYAGKYNDIEIKRVIFEDDSIWNAPVNLEMFE